jgi:hypothetical protein
MIQLRKPYLLERLVYIVIWIIVFLAPVVIAYWAVRPEVEQGFSWRNVSLIWLHSILPFFLLFCLNNFLLAPYFLLRKKYVRYVISVLAALCFFIWANITFLHKEPMPGFPGAVRRQMMERSFTRAPDFQVEESQMEKPPRRALPGRIRPPFQGWVLMPALFRFLIAVLMTGFNIAIKFLIKSLQDEEVMKELEHRKLQSELEYLKYQINPHFFMNTLNNIYALVDINKAHAKKAIVEYSKMMRYVLYEANNEAIPLSREILFLNNYIELMRLRYIEKVNVKAFLPEDIPAVKIPPLLYISFIENAFKHGVSYRSDSLIYVAMRIEEGDLVFTCSNTNNGKSKEQHKGIGLDNIQKRLKLLYGDKYRLSMNESPDSFNVLLIIPLI